MLHCLIVDDIESNRLIAKHFMEKLGFNVHEAASVYQALPHIASGECKLVLLDWMMPEIEGVEMLEMLRETAKGKELVVIMCTAKTGEKNRRAAMKAGVNAYLEKPLEFDSLKKVLQGLGYVLASQGG